MRRLLCGVLSLSVLLTAAGCTLSTQPENQESDLPCINIQIFGGTADAAAQRISETASRITREKLGCRVEFQFVERTDYSAELNCQRLGDGLTDIFVVESNSDLVEMVASGEILCLDSLLQDSVLCDEINSYEWYSVTLDDHRYGVPFNNSQPTSLAFCMRMDICRELGIDPAQIKTMDQLQDALLLVQEKYPDLVPVVPNYSEIAPTNLGMWDTPIYDSRTSSIGVLPYNDPMTGQLSLITQTPQFWDWCRTMYRWNQQGLTLRYPSFNQEARVALMGAGKAFGGFMSYNASTALNQQINVIDELGYAILSEPYIDSGYSNLAFGISSRAENPALCVQLLELLYTDVDLLRLCTYGEEGIDYEVVDGEYHALTQETPHHVVNLWCWPNNRKLFEKEYLRQWEDEWKRAEISPMMGFAFDSSGCEQQAGACYQLMNQYYRMLMNGEGDPEILIPELEQKILAAGGETVLAEMQQQLNEWIAAH